MPRELVRIDGLREIDEALTELGEEFHPRNPRNVARAALRDGGQIIADAGEAAAPRRSGKLADSYTVGGKLSRRQRQMHKKASDIEVFVGPTPHPKSVQTEFGNAHQAAHPHLRPAWDGNFRRVLDLVVRRLKERLDQTTARLRKRAAKDAS